MTTKGERSSIFQYAMSCRDSSMWNKAKRFLNYVLLHLQRHKYKKNLAITFYVSRYFSANIPFISET